MLYRLSCGFEPADEESIPAAGRAMKNRLKELRAEKSWSQGDLAERLEVSRQTINAIETEKYDPSLPLAFKIAKLFKQPIEEIFAADRS
jgi:putative transcriptional regulator